MKFGVVGGPGNLAARIESCTRGGQILASQATLDSLDGAAQGGEQRNVQLKGIRGPVVLYGVIGLDGRPDLGTAATK